MHKILADRIEYDHEVDDNLMYEIPILCDAHMDGSIMDIGALWKEKINEKTYSSFDEWQNLLDRDTELGWFEDALVANTKQHIMGVSTSQEVELLREFYERVGYFSDYPRKCLVPLPEAKVTASVPIHNLVYSSKDKNRLSQRALYPPVRSPSDQRVILTGLRTGVLVGIDASLDDEDLVRHLLTREIISPFELGRLLCFNLVDRGISGTPRHLRIRQDT